MASVQSDAPVAQPAPAVEKTVEDKDSVMAEEPTKTAVDTPAEPAVAKVEAVAETPAEVTSAEEAQAEPEAVQEEVAAEPAEVKADEPKAGEVEAEAKPEEEVEEVVETTKGGFLGQRGPRPLRIWQKRYFAFRDEPYALSDLHLVYKKNSSAALQLIRGGDRTSSGKGAETNKHVESLHRTMATATVSSQGLLYYFKSEKDTARPLGIINLRDVPEDSPVAEKSVRANAFSLKTHTRTYMLSAASDKDLKSWLKTLKEGVAAAQDLPDLAEDETYKASLQQLTEGKAFGKPAVTTPKAGAVSDNEVFSGSEVEPDATDKKEGDAPETTDATPSTSTKRKSYFAAFDTFIKGFKHEAPTPKTDEKAAESAETTEAKADAPAEEEAAKSEAEVEIKPEAEVTDKSIEAAKDGEVKEPATAAQSPAEQAKQKAKELGTFISKFLPKRGQAEAVAADKPGDEAEAKPEADAAKEGDKAAEEVPAAEPMVEEAAAPETEADKPAEEAAAETAAPAPRTSSPLGRTLTKIFRPLHLNKAAEPAEVKDKAEPEAKEEEAKADETDKATDAPAEEQAEAKAEEPAAETAEDKPAEAAESTEEDKKAAKPTSFLKRLGTLGRGVRGQAAAVASTSTEAAKEGDKAPEIAKDEVEAPVTSEGEGDAEAPVAPLKSGFLQKQSHFVRGYDRKFVSLTPEGSLVYGKSEKETKGLKSVPVTKTTKINKVDDGKRPFSFDVVNANRTYRLVADSDEERTSWMDALIAFQETLPEPEPEAKAEEPVTEAEPAKEEAKDDAAPVLPKPDVTGELTEPAAEETPEVAKVEETPAQAETEAPKAEEEAPKAKAEEPATETKAEEPTPAKTDA
ncbi:hypothetical protein H4R34_000002 [Dimargaris verticillata]|uniref:PH domain-containing protein n=1 Tax=Dimargaris verticillata TaxID=2761393 RepID=A0A9W8EBN5_9FUNG|nr:hypothetical protein H4R34_000002 [Dimargaris verticillata]